MALDVVADGHVAHLDGDIDLAVADAIEAEILRRTEPSAALVVDLTAVSFLDSAGVRLVDRLVYRHEAAGSGVAIVAPEGGSPRFSLRVCGFRPDLLVDTLPAALQTVGRR
ncbi:STAS domain-containing protein [Planosporangium sp. 12N6]|uniref:STAS domain-containing protein n=1 Tax=Planosporangium spinosum TaxID=3402278 RepID=UPI003CF12439